MRIAFVGAGGTGKTTLGLALAETLKLPFHRSVNRAVFAQFGYTQLTHTELSPAQRWEIQCASFQAKIAQDDKYQSGIFERTLLDHYMYCLLYCYEAIDPMTHAMLRQQVIDNLIRYDILYYFPIYEWPQPEDGFRDASSTNRELQDLILQGFLAKYGDPALERKLETLENISVEQRIEYIKLDLEMYNKYAKHLSRIR